MSSDTAAPVPSSALDLSKLRLFQDSSTVRSLWQVGSTFALYVACVVAMYASLRVSVWLTLALSVPAGGLIVRIFMLQHDCGHGSLFRSARANRLVGTVCSAVTLTPFAYWRRLHARHHGSWNNLDSRGIPADFFSDCLTTREYQALHTWPRRLYRAAHHPALMYFLLPPVIFILVYRVPFDTPASCRRERVSVYLLNLGLLCIFGGLAALLGPMSVMLVHLPALVLAAITGIWLFSVQHRFEGAHWASKQDWRFAQASLDGTSYLRLPLILQWFSASIGLHHVHHLRPGIPNYRLQACHDSCSEITSRATVLSLRDALGAPNFALWDDDLGHMIPFPRRGQAFPLPA